jgi:hypothetical protein
MRPHLTLLLAATLLAGCSSFRDVFSSHAETAARVGDRELKSAYVADVISRVGGPNANPEAAEVVANVWVDLALFTERVARGTLQSDSASLDRLLWPQLANSKSSAWHDTLVARRPRITDATADSVYQEGVIRVFQHILVRPEGTTAADTARARSQAERILPQARANFANAAGQHSADDANKADGGFLPASPRGAFVPEFENPAWELAPGQVSSVVQSPFGFHIIRRPAMSEARERLMPELVRRQTAQMDSIYFAELDARNELKVSSGAPGAMRTALSDLGAARRSRKELVSFKDGGFTVGDFARWMGALGQPQLSQIRQSNDSMLQNFAKNLAQNTILLREADSAGIQVDPALYQGLLIQYQALIGDLRRTIGLDTPEFSDSSSLSVDDRVRLGGQKLDDYFERLTQGQAQFRQVPPTLSAELRAEGDYKIYQAGIARAGELILAKRRADSAAGGAQQAPPAPGLQPAPGGPPEPGKQP